jgi:uncharacterized membrane protein YbhN (UPF0104 family)
VGLVVLVGLVATRVDPAAVAASWRGASAADLGVITFFFLAAMAVRVSKWALQLRTLGFGFHPPTLARNFLLAVLLGAVTPMRVGEAWRLDAVQLAPGEKAPQLAVIGASLLLEKAYEVLGLLLLVAASALLLDEGRALLLSTAPLLAVGFVLGVAPTRPPASLLHALPTRIRTLLAEPLLRARDGLGGRGRLGLLGLTLASHLLNYAGGLHVYRLFGDMSAALFLGRAPLVTLTNVLPVSVGGFGVREVAAMELFGAAGYPPSSAAVAASLMFLGANLVPLLALPFLWVWARVDPEPFGK